MINGRSPRWASLAAEPRRKEAHLDSSALPEQERNQRADHNRREECLQGNAQCHEVAQKHAGALGEMILAQGLGAPRVHQPMEERGRSDTGGKRGHPAFQDEAPAPVIPWRP
jgi:hypothetical protein